MDQKPSPRSDSRAGLSAALGEVDAALEALDPDGRDRAAHTGFWAAWLQWMLRLLAFELALAWDDPCPPAALACDAWGTTPAPWPQADAGTATTRPVPPRALERKITRLLEAAAHVWAFGHPPAARPLRRRRRRPMLRAFSWTGAVGRRDCLPPPTTGGLLGARVLALCKP
jgi:hypothetical protein